MEDGAQQVSQGALAFRSHKEELGWAWLAGILDGEGSVRVKSDKLGHQQLELRVSMTHKPTLDRIKEISGSGSVILTSPRPMTRKPLFLWHCQARQAAAVLRAVFPYLVTKKEQASLAIEFAQLVQLTPRGVGKTLPIGLATKRAHIAQEMRKLNTK